MSEKKTPEDIVKAMILKYGRGYAAITHIVESMQIYASQECAERDRRIAELEGKLNKIENIIKDNITFHKSFEGNNKIAMYRRKAVEIVQAQLTEILK